MSSIGLISLLASIPLGALGWFATNFVARPILRAYELREKVWEELLVSSNLLIFDGEAYAQSSNNLRRYAAHASALDVSWPRTLRWLLRALKLDLAAASQALLGLSNVGGAASPDALDYRRRAAAALHLPTALFEAQAPRPDPLDTEAGNDRSDPARPRRAS